MPDNGYTFQRGTAKFWRTWSMPPKIEESLDILFVDGLNTTYCTPKVFVSDRGSSFQTALRKKTF